MKINPFILLLLSSIQSSTPAPTFHHHSSTHMVKYLVRFGYMDPATPYIKSSRDFVGEAVRKFQEFAGLEVTGKVDGATRRMMQMPRCGVRDIGDKNNSSLHRSKRFVLQGSRWKTKKLSYRIASYPTNLRVDITRDQVDEEIKKALNIWQEVTNIQFEEKPNGKVNIEIRFASLNHGDNDPFDGPGNILAHAFFPTFGGDAHFDNEELWTVESYRGTNLFLTAAHEFGHSLGLSHSNNFKALMAPFYRGYRPGQELLDQDDINGIQALYGKKFVVKPTTSLPLPIDPIDTDLMDNENLCGGVGVDTIVTTDDGATYVFKGDLYWKLTAESVEAGYPKLISNEWNGLPGNLDASFTWTNGKTFFFKGTKFWRISRGKIDTGYPKKISKSFAGIPNNLDAALMWSGNQKIYFFKKDKYWKFDPYSRRPLKKSYPKPVSRWGGVPNGLDAALRYSNGRTYFFKGGLYYRYDDRNLRIEEAEPTFPRSSAKWWFGCEQKRTEPQDKRKDDGIYFNPLID